MEIIETPIFTMLLPYKKSEQAELTRKQLNSLSEYAQGILDEKK